MIGNWSIDRKLKEIREEGGYRLSYDGETTRTARYIELLEHQQNYWGWKRLQPENMPKRLKNLF